MPVYNVSKGFRGLDWENDDLRVLLVSSSYTFDPDHEDVADITNELSGTGYARKALASLSVTIDNTGDVATHTAADVTWTGADFGTIARAVVYVHDAGGDASSRLVCCVNLTSPLVTNGGDASVEWDDTDGIIKTADAA